MSDDLRELVSEAVADATEDLRDRVDQLEDERDELAERVEDLEEDLAFWKKNIWGLEDAIFGEDMDLAAASSIAETDGSLWERVEDLEAGSTGGKRFDALADEDPSKMLPIEKLAALPDDVAKQQLDNAQNRNLYRARHIWNNWDEIATKTGNYENRASHLKSRDVKMALNTWAEEDAKVESKTVERVFHRLTEWTFWLSEIRHKSGERRLWRPGDWKDQREDARGEAEIQGHHLADSVVSGAE